jgi:hypothetical protein
VGHFSVGVDICNGGSEIHRVARCARPNQRFFVRARLSEDSDPRVGCALAPRSLVSDFRSEVDLVARAPV